jgi:hypothetical protein
MKSALSKIMLSLLIISGLTATSALAGARDHHCRDEYNRKVREAKHLHGRERSEKLAQAKREYNECRGEHHH